jgi:hypothetical protein
MFAVFTKAYLNRTHAFINIKMNITFNYIFIDDINEK